MSQQKNVNNIQENTDDSIQPDLKRAPKFPFLIRRFIEIFTVTVICSIPIALIFQFNIIDSQTWKFRFVCLSFIAFILINAYLLRAFYFSMGNRKIYFSVNVIAYIMFSVVNVFALSLLNDSVYSYMFMPIKFINAVINTIISSNTSSIQISCAILTHLLMLCVIVISPFEMYSFDKKRK